MSQSSSLGLVQVLCLSRLVSQTMALYTPEKYWPMPKYVLRSKGFCSDHQCGQHLGGCCPRACNSDKPHYVFMHVEKTGGSSIECALQSAADNDVVDLIGHSNSSVAYACQSRCRSSRTIRILSVRNPFSYWKSVYYYAWECIGNRCPSQERARLVKDEASGVSNDFSSKGVLSSFESFLRFVSKSPRWKHMTQSERIRNKCGRPCHYDELLHTESLSEDWTSLVQRNPGLPKVALPLVNEGANSSRHPWGPPPTALYTPRLIALVRELEAYVIQVFNYQSYPWEKGPPAPPKLLSESKSDEKWIAVQRLFAELNVNYSKLLYGAPNGLDKSRIRIIWANLVPPVILKRLVVRCGNPHETDAGALLYLKPNNHYNSQAIWVHWSKWQQDPNSYASHAWVEVTHCEWIECNVSMRTPMWFLAAPGSGARLNIGRTVVVRGPNEPNGTVSRSGIHLALVQGDFRSANSLIRHAYNVDVATLDSVQFLRYTGQPKPHREWVNEIVMLRMFSEPDSLTKHLNKLRCGPAKDLRECNPTDAAVMQMATCGDLPHEAIQSVLRQSKCKPGFSSSWGNANATFRHCKSQGR